MRRYGKPSVHSIARLERVVAYRKMRMRHVADMIAQHPEKNGMHFAGEVARLSEAAVALSAALLRVRAHNTLLARLGYVR